MSGEREGWGRRARLLARLVKLAVPVRVAESVLRDLDDAYRTRAARESRSVAQRWLRRQLIATLRPDRLRELRALRRSPAIARHGVGWLVRALRALAGCGADLRHAARLLWKRPAYSALTVIVLAGGLSVSIFTFSFLHSALYAPLPIPGGESVVRILAIEKGWMNLLDAADLVRLRASGLESFDRVGAYETRHVLVEAAEETRAIYATVAEPVMFDVAAVRPLMGRRLLESDARPGAEPVVVVSHSVWRATFGADPGLVDRMVDLNGVATRVVGVMPEGFGFPVFGEIWLPLPDEVLPASRRGERAVDVFATLGEGVSHARANAELQASLAAIRAADPDPEAQYPDAAIVRTFQKAQLGDEAELMFFTVNLAATFILLLAGVNAANLLLARGIERAREIKVRLALGAPRLRLVTQMMAEGALITLLAGALGAALAARALSMFDAGARAASPEGLAYWWHWGFDGAAATATVVLVGATLLLVGGIPAWSVTRAAGGNALRDDERPGQDHAGSRFSGTVVVLQIAVIALLLFVGGMTSLVAHRAGQVDLGIETDRVLLGMVSLDGDDYRLPAARMAFLARLDDEMGAQSAVVSTLFRATLGGGLQALEVDGQRYERAEDRPGAHVRLAMGDLDTIGVRALAGRLFDERDAAAGTPVAMVSESLARKLWAASPVGRRILIADEVTGDSGSPWREVVGVVSDVLEGNPIGRDRSYETVYVPMAQLPPTGLTVTFRHRGDARAAVSALHQALAAVDPGVRPDRVEDFEAMLDTMRNMSSTVTSVLLGCFGFALLLAIGGIYGLTARSVTLRVPEIGVRRALGATDGRIVRLLMRGGVRQLATGLGIAAIAAAVLAVAVTRFIELDSLLWIGISVAVPALISAIVLAATWLPTRRAIGLSPREAIWRD